MRYFFIFLIILFYLLLSFIYPNYFKQTTFDSATLFLKVIMPSIIPMYFISSLLLRNKFFIKFTNSILNKLNYFDSNHSSSLFFINFLVGNPTATIFIVEKFKENNITRNDVTKLLSCSFMNPVFVINSFKLGGFNHKFAYLYIFVSLVSNLLIIGKKRSNNKLSFNDYQNVTINEIINSLSKTLLNIFCITLIISYIKIPILFNNNVPLVIKIIFDFLEVSSGFLNISKLGIQFNLKIILLILLLSSSGLCIIFQTIFFIKEKAPVEHRYFIKSLLIGKFYNSIITSVMFLLFFKFLF